MLNCTLICDRAVKIAFQEPRKQRRQQLSFLLLLLVLCTFAISFFPPPVASDVKGFGAKMHTRGRGGGGGGGDPEKWIKKK